MKILIAGGGSGGHIFPASALVYELQRKNKDIDFIFAISGRTEEKIITDYLCSKLSNFRVKIIPLFPLRGRDIFARTDFLARLVWAGVYSFLFVLLQRPGIVIGFGGYLSGPLILSAFILGIPTLIHEQNVYPGRTNLILANFVKKVALSFKESRCYFKKTAKLTFTGNPLRQDLKSVDKKTAASRFGFNPDLFTILVLGGSQGARAINENFIGMLEGFKKKGLDLQFIHITGIKDYPWVNAAYERLKLNAKVYALYSDVSLAYGCCDLVITRAGASTLNELSYLAKTVIAIPYPYSRAHQLLNAAHYSKKGAIVILEEKNLNSESLFNRIYEIINHKGESDLLKQRIKELNSPDGARLLAQEVRGLIYAD